MYKNDKVLQELWTFLDNHLRSIEVNYVTNNGEELLTKVYFPFAPTVSTFHRKVSLYPLCNRKS